MLKCTSVSTLKKTIANLPQTPGIYQFYDKDKKLLYVGKSVSIKHRVNSYFTSKNLGPKTTLLVKNIKDIKYIKVFSEFEALLLEAELIRTHKPFFNIEAKDDKSPIYIKISNGLIPLLSTTRKEKTKKGIFLKGPFPSAKTTKAILKQLRKIFPYCQHKNPKTPCLFVHLGLCPYPYGTAKAKEKYTKDIVKIKTLLSGKSKVLIRELKAEMQCAARELRFEDAQLVKKQMLNLQYLTTTYTTPREFMERPTLVDDLTMARLKDIKKELGLKKLPRRIECYDISNFQGTNATGSMVVFINGQSDKGQYRRFKIKFTNKPNDYEMIREVIARRLKNDWPEADLMIIDGGIGQLNSAIGMITKYKKKIPIVSLAKRLEEIYIPDTKVPISLPAQSPARQLVQALRDEAHRFAIGYHKLLRAKIFLK